MVSSVSSNLSASHTKLPEKVAAKVCHMREVLQEFPWKNHTNVCKKLSMQNHVFFVVHLFEFSQLVGWLVDSPSCAPQCSFAPCLDGDDARHILRNRHQGGSLGKTIHRQRVETTFRLRLNQDLGATNLHLVEDLDAAQHEILGFSTFETVGDREGRLQRHRHRRCSRVPFGDQQLRQRCWRHLKGVLFFQIVRWECAKNTKHKTPFQIFKHKEKIRKDKKRLKM